MSSRISISLAAATAVLVAAIPSGTCAEEQIVSVKIVWEYKDLPANMKIFEPPARAILKLWKTSSVKDPKDVPVSSEIAESVLKLQRGETKTFVLVYKNDTQKPLYFFAAPHQVNPPEHSLGFKMKCLCINHAFQVGPGETWYRVVELKIAKDMSGDAVAIKHTLVGISKERMKKFDMSSGQLMPE